MFRPLSRRSALRESLLSRWKVGIHRTLRVRDGRQVHVEANEASYVSFDRLGDPWPS